MITNAGDITQAQGRHSSIQPWRMGSRGQEAGLAMSLRFVQRRLVILRQQYSILVEVPA